VTLFPGTAARDDGYRYRTRHRRSSARCPIPLALTVHVDAIRHDFAVISPAPGTSIDFRRSGREGRCSRLSRITTAA
jgi:hypothetical protein